MNEGAVQRRLSAVLAADVAGYTRLMEQDTHGTVAAWQRARTDTIDPAIAEYSGRIVKHTGDGFLAEFPTVLDAVSCAIELQGRLANGPLEFRMGVNLGDIVDDGEDIHGEGVNIAARLEGLADAGGICVSGGVYEQVRNQIDAAFEDIGEREVKHVSAPVRVYRVALDGQVARPVHRPAASPDEGGEKRLDQDLKLGGLIMLFIAPGLAVLGWFVDAVKPMLGVAVLVVFIAVGLLAAAKIIGKRLGNGQATASD